MPGGRGGLRSGKTDLSDALDKGKFDKLYDLRPKRYETARFIAECLERHCVARIKRG
ncbi:MAG: hypothetical protein JNK04_16860 [Myxococcales bacterium]|nr:hypothetical protein [Myxococcales bacterium]